MATGTGRRGQQEGRGWQAAQGFRIARLQGIRRAYQQYAELLGLPFDRDPHPVGLLGSEQIRRQTLGFGRAQ